MFFSLFSDINYKFKKMPQDRFNNAKTEIILLKYIYLSDAKSSRLDWPVGARRTNVDDVTHSCAFGSQRIYFELIVTKISCWNI